MYRFNPKIPFDLPKLPPKIDLKDERIYSLLINARAELGELKGYAQSLPNPMLLLSPAIVKESVASSNIENINTTVENVFQQNLFPEIERREPDKEVLRYRNAILMGYDEMKNIPISSRLIELIHRELMREKSYGFRKDQNKIENSGNKETVYTPPSPNMLPDLLSNMEKFIHDESPIDPLIKCAMTHYQFEAIHPFGDGNGRTGRIIMVLQLVHYGVLSLPILYISGYINKNKSEYYRLLNEVTSNGEWLNFIQFILSALHLQAKETKQVLFKIMNLYYNYKDSIKRNHKKIYQSDLVDTMFSSPVLTPVSLGERLNIHYTTATRYLNELKKNGYLKDLEIGRYHFYINNKLMEIINE